MSAWDGDFSLILQSNLAYAKAEFKELDDYLLTDEFRNAPATVRFAVQVAWVKAKDAAALHASCSADFCSAWFDDSAFLATADSTRRGT